MFTADLSSWLIVFPFWNSILFLLEVLVAFLPPCPGCLFHTLSYFQVPHPITLELLFPLYLPSWDLQPPTLACPWWSFCLLFCCHTALCCVLNSTSSSFFVYSFILLQHMFKSLGKKEYVEGSVVECLRITNSLPSHWIGSLPGSGILDWNISPAVWGVWF